MAFHLCELTHEALTCRHLWTFCHNDCIWSYSFQYLFWWHCGIYCNIKILRISCVLACICPIYHKRSIQMTSFSCLITVTKINSQETLLEIGFSFTVQVFQACSSNHDWREYGRKFFGVLFPLLLSPIVTFDWYFFIYTILASVETLAEINALFAIWNEKQVFWQRILGLHLGIRDL